ncbi:ABC transporter ATP-binding protein [Phytohabitans suffuscus]|uniref:Sugar ABC transporter ATP-binding protein n=1 Tax=Phytohabitans suffuscus TaxID=624315 RepID=A0A6F8YLZ9_9ACTN|nr:ABC transporter ATP-binding protein [Phytohabitans suffuscus]BCB87120.1 sugar ABC transporter ATP-binding protein [Phytohabitans suffuscus]
MVAIATDRLTKVFPDGTVAVDEVTIEAASGEFLVLLGPTGCGKSTILRLVAGLEEETSGHVLIDGRVVDRLSAKERRVAMVFQDYALYPHLTVAQNIGFPLRAGYEASAGTESRVAEVAEHLGVHDLLHRLPGHLSGGQRQRVAMARAIVRKPQAFLLDEPLSNLDAGLRAELRADVAGLARRLGVTTLYVTHDQTEAMTMADRVAVLRRGVLQQVGPPAEVYGDPATLFVAAFLGTPRTNLLQGAIYVEPERTVIDLGSQLLELPPSDALAHHHNDRVTVAVRADALQPVPDGSAQGPFLRGEVRLVENLGHEALVHLDTGIVPTPIEESRLEHPDTGQHLADVIAEDPPVGRPFRQALARMMPHARQESPGPATARTEYGFYPVYDAELSDQPPLGDVVVRVPAPVLPRRGEPMTVRVDVDRLMLFDRGGHRIRTS